MDQSLRFSSNERNRAIYISMGVKEKVGEERQRKQKQERQRWREIEIDRERE